MASDINIGTPYLPINNIIGPGPKGIPNGPPKGFKPLSKANSEISNVAKKLLNNEFGTVIPFQLNGLQYIARVEPHYHPPGFKGGPNGWHKGITVYESANATTEQNQLNTSNVAPQQMNREELFEKIDDFFNQFGEFK